MENGRRLRSRERASVNPSAMTDRSRFSIIPIGSLHTGWALKVDGITTPVATGVTMGFRQHGYMGALFGFACALDRGIPQASLDQESPS